MDETLIIEKLGPIRELEIKPRPLTIIIGEQASGKSLVAQLLYFFRGLQQHVARVYRPKLVSSPTWQNEAIKSILDLLRGVSFGYFANGTGNLRYQNRQTGADWEISVDERSHLVTVKDNLKDTMSEWVKDWQNDPESLGKAKFGEIFVPTERGLIARLLDTQPNVLYGQFQPMPLIEFAALLTALASSRRDIFTAMLDFPAPTQDMVRRHYSDSFIGKCRNSALGGEAAVTEDAHHVWVWKTDSKVMPILGTSTGQMEAWPFFEIAHFVDRSGTSVNVYFEEPETHVHPRAQVEIMKVVAYLVNRGHNFVITTHSPFLLQVVDNMLQRFMKLKGKIPEGEERWLDPEKVAAYCLRRDSDQSPVDIMDRENTGLLDATELEKVANELGAEFDDLLYGTE